MLKNLNKNNSNNQHNNPNQGMLLKQVCPTLEKYCIKDYKQETKKEIFNSKTLTKISLP